MIASHGCGARWSQGGNTTGHCCSCHRTFHSEKAFEAHRTPDGEAPCVDPATLLAKDGKPRFETVVDSVGCEVWWSTRRMDAAGKARLNAMSDGPDGSGDAP